MQLQTVAAAEVARVLANVAEGQPRGSRLLVAGPELTTDHPDVRGTQKFADWLANSLVS